MDSFRVLETNLYIGIASHAYFQLEYPHPCESVVVYARFGLDIDLKCVEKHHKNRYKNGLKNKLQSYLTNQAVCCGVRGGAAIRAFEPAFSSSSSAMRLE